MEITITQKTTFIYTLLHPITKEIRYIGKSNKPHKRLYTHIERRFKTKSHKNNWIKSLLNKNLKPIIEVLDEVPMDEWEFWEIYWISQFRSWGFKLTNLSDGGRGPNGTKHSNKTKQKMGKSRIGIPLSDEHKKKISIRGKEHHKENPSYNMKGKNERVPIDRDLLYDLYITQNLSIPQTSNELKLSEKKIWDELNHYDIHKEDGWWLDKISEQYKKVTIQYDLKGNLIREWKGLIDIENELGYNNSNIANCCRGLIKTSNNFIWRYKDEWISLDDSMKTKQGS